MLTVNDWQNSAENCVLLDRILAFWGKLCTLRPQFRSEKKTFSQVQELEGLLEEERRQRQALAEQVASAATKLEV